MWPTTDAPLLDRALMGEEKAWTEFEERYRPAVARWLGIRGVQSADADDVFQDLSVLLFQRLRQYDSSKGRFRPWLRAVLRNTLVDHSRSWANVPGAKGYGGSDGTDALARLHTEESLDRLVGELDAMMPSADGAQWEVVRKLIPPNDLACYMAIECYGREYDDVAAEFGRPKHAVHQSVFRARERIRAYRAGRTGGS